MLTISVTHNIAETVQGLGQKFARQVPYAAARALTATAQAARDNQKREMRDVFSQPTPYTLGGVFIKPATRSTLTATVGLKSDHTSGGRGAGVYLRSEIAGGGRSIKAFESSLRSVGVLPEGMVTVPGKAASLDAYGNISRGQIMQILSYFKAAELTAGRKANITDKRKERMARGTKKKHGVAFFVGRPAGGKLPLGIWKRMSSQMVSGSGIAPILLFVDSATYQAVYDFPYVVKMTIEQEFGKQFEAAWKEAVASTK